MRSFNIQYNENNSVVFSFGRFNPPTIGHEQLINIVNQVASKNLITRSYIIPTGTQNTKKDPLFLHEKINILNHMVPSDVEVMNMTEFEGRTWFDIMTNFYKEGVQKVIQVAGSDRIREFQSLYDRYNGNPDTKGNLLYNFPEGAYEIVSSGQRDPDSADVEGMSASKLRQLALQGFEDKFKAGMSDSVPDDLKVKTFRDIRERLK